MAKTLLFSVTAKDCDWSYTRGTGNGGQKRNKTSSAVHCKHTASGARGYAEDDRSQHKNKQFAFIRMTKTKEFQAWLTVETRRKTGAQAIIEDTVNRELRNIKVEVKDANGLWTEVPKDATLQDTE